MKKTIIATLISLCCTYSNATQILWAGIDDNAKIYFNDGSSQAPSAFDYDTQLNTVKIGLYDSSSTLISYLGFYYEESGTWYNDSEETDLYSYDERDGSILGYNDWIPVTIPNNATDSMKVRMELGFVDLTISDENDPSTWDIFHSFAYSDFVTIGYLNDNNHTYPTFDLNPPIQSPWRPSTFNAVPEPSATILAALGIGMLLKRRK